MSPPTSSLLVDLYDLVYLCETSCCDVYIVRTRDKVWLSISYHYNVIHEIHVEVAGTAKKFQKTSVGQNGTWRHNGKQANDVQLRKLGDANGRDTTRQSEKFSGRRTESSKALPGNSIRR